MKTPVSLLERLRQPLDQEAWARFVDLYTPLLYRWARQQGLRPAEASDLVQDVLLLLVRKLPEFRYDPLQRFRGWLRTVLLNKWRENRRRSDPLRAASREQLEEVPGPDATGEWVEREYRQHLVGRALELMRAEFEPTTWKACWEFVVSGRPAAEVAGELGITLNAVYLAKGRVLRRLRQELDGLFE